MVDSAAGEEDEEEVVAVLDRDSWEDRTQEAELALVHFHTDWCRHCRSRQYIARWQIKYLLFVLVLRALMNTWEELAARYKGLREPSYHSYPATT